MSDEVPETEPVPASWVGVGERIVLGGRVREVSAYQTYAEVGEDEDRVRLWFTDGGTDTGGEGQTVWRVVAE